MSTKPRSPSPLRYGRPPSQQHLGSALKSSAAAKPSFKSQSLSPNTPSSKLRGGTAPVSPSLSGGSSVSTATLSEKTDPSAKSKENVSVTVRFRPLSAREIQKGDEIAWYADGNDTVRSESNASTAYVFDKVFGPATTTRGVYDVAAQYVVNGAMEGINGTVFAYGVTSSGKTHTMHGDQKSPGIIPLAVKDVFNIIQETPNREFLLRVSYLEIYNEVINDLLDPAGQNLRVREDAHGTYVEGIKEEVVLSPAHALSLIAAGEEHRHVGSNNVNLMSSRSHTIFTMTIESSARGEGSCDEEVTLSQLNLIDLAGSESSKAETTGLRRKEGSYINKSLLTLGTVISKLTDGKSSHIPYRDSKLTRLLQSSLGGHGRVSLICTVTPASSSNEETHNTLKFAHRAKHVELQSSANKILDEKSLIKKYQKEISSLKQELERLKKGLVGKPLSDPAHNDLIQLRQQLEAGQVRLQSRLEEEEQAKAALMGRIQRLTKLILVSSKSSIPEFHERPAHRRRYSFGEEELSYLPDRRRALNLEDEEDIEIDLPELSDGKAEVASPDNMTKDEKKSKRRGVLAWFKVKKQPEQLNSDADTGLTSSSEENKASKQKPPRRKLDELPQVDPFPEPTQAGELFSAAGHGRRPPPSGTTMADQMDLLREQVKMLAGEVAFSTSSLKRLGEQAAHMPNDTTIQAQIQKLKVEIQSKNQQMKMLEQRIAGGFKSAPFSSASAELSQKVVKLTTQLSEKTFELEIKTADNRILQEQLQSKNAETLELQSTINSLKQQLEKKEKGHNLFDTIDTSDWLETVDLVEEFPLVDGRESNRYFAATKADQPGVLRSQVNEVERLKQEKARLLAEGKDHEAQKQKLVEEASYAKELATAAAVELKSLAEEVTKLSAQNSRLTNARSCVAMAPVHGAVLLLLLAVLGTCTSYAASVSASEAIKLRDEVKDMFYHAYNGYMNHAFPLDELRPLSCSGEDSLGGYSLTLVDALDMLAILGDKENFGEAVKWIGKHLRFDKNKTISVFETNIRVLGGLLSAHLIASDQATGMKVPEYNGELLTLAEDLGRRLLPAFETPTGIPFGSVNLLHGVSETESEVTSTAGGGTLTLEFGVLSRLTRNPVFEEVSRTAVRGLWAQRSHIGLVGAHINVNTGEWTHKDAGIGTSVDSFYEYLLKAYLLLGEDEYLHIFREAYKAVMRYLFNDPWYLEVNMNSAHVVWPLFNSLQAFWPGLQVLAGDVEPAIRTHRAFFSVWKKFGFTPEGFNLATMNVQPGQRSYPLRPELIESTYWLYKATRHPTYLDAGRDILASLQYGARCPCGYCHIVDVETHEKEDHMESFFLAETVKYLWLLFDLAAGGNNIVESGPYSYIFSTEGHLFPLKPEISLPEDQCSYPGSSCLFTDRHANSTSSRLVRQMQDKPDRPLKGTCPELGVWRQLGIADNFVNNKPSSSSNKKTDRVQRLQAGKTRVSFMEAIEKAGLKLVKVNMEDEQ